MGATFNRLKNWIAEVLTYADLNAEIDNILNNLGPAGVDDYSVNVAQMQLTTDPGEVGSESQATSLAGEIERLRYAIAEIKGTAQWYTSADTSLDEIANALGGNLVANRITSGAMSNQSSQPLFLDPSGSADSLTILGLTTPLVYSIEGTTYTIDSNVVISNLVSAPTSQNTALINQPIFADQLATKFAGEYGTSIAYDNVGSEITSRDGKLAAFKVNNGAATEYFVARIDNANSKLVDVYRGFFFDSSQAEIPRIVLTDNDTITIQSLAWIYATTGEIGIVSYTEPTIGPTEPTSPAVNDYWYDTVTSKWKRFDVATFVDADATLIGLAVINESDVCVATRAFDFYRDHDATNTIRLEYVSAGVVRTIQRRNTVSVYGSSVIVNQDYITWDMALNLESGVTEASSTPYYFYLSETGKPIISDIAPHDRVGDLVGFYHPHETWRYVGKIDNDGSSNFLIATLRNAPENQTAPTESLVTATATWSFTPGLRKLFIRAVGGGGGGGGTAMTGVGEGANGSGGGGGEYGEKIIRTNVLSCVETITIGAGGTSGNAGTTTSFGAHITCAGGGAGSSGAATSGNGSVGGGSGGTGGSGGDFYIAGDQGGNGRVISGNAVSASYGGASHISGIRAGATSGNGLAGTLYGGGGSGASEGASSAARSGGTGGAAAVIIGEYYN